MVVLLVSKLLLHMPQLHCGFLCVLIMVQSWSRSLVLVKSVAVVSTALVFCAAAAVSAVALLLPYNYSRRVALLCSSVLNVVAMLLDPSGPPVRHEEGDGSAQRGLRVFLDTACRGNCCTDLFVKHRGATLIV